MVYHQSDTYSEDAFSVVTKPNFSVTLVKTHSLYSYSPPLSRRVRAILTKACQCPSQDNISRFVFYVYVFSMTMCILNIMEQTSTANPLT